MLKYDNFLLESKIYNLIKESKVRFSDNFLSTIRSIDSPISKEIIDLNNKDKDIIQNYVDLDTNTNDMITFIQDSRAKQITKDSKSTFKIVNSAKHLKTENFQKEEGKAQNSEVYRLLGLNIEDAQKAGNDIEIEIIDEIQSPFEPTKTYCSYKWVSDPDKKAVINKEGVKEFEETFQKLWTTSRNAMKIGRFIRSVMPITGKTFTDSEIEKFVNLYKSTIDIMNDAFSKFDIVSGQDLVHFYNIRNYASDNGQLGSSCMANADDNWLYIYSANPDVCQLVVLYDDNGQIVDGKYKSSKIKGRALLWTTRDNIKFMDRIYMNDDSDEQLYKKFADKNNWFYKIKQQTSDRFTAQSNNTVIDNPIYVVKLKKLGSEFPYLDTLCYLNSDTYLLSNNYSEINSNMTLNDTGGGHEGSYNDDDDW